MQVCCVAPWVRHTAHACPGSRTDTGVQRGLAVKATFLKTGKNVRWVILWFFIYFVC